MNFPNKLILFDGVCNLCDEVINFIIKKDRKRLFRYTSLQSTIGKKLSIEYGLPTNNYKTFIYIKKGSIYVKSNAVLEICKDMGFPWNSLYISKFVIPVFLRNMIYAFVSKNRYFFFGKKEYCQIPTKELKDLFLE